MKIKVKFLLLFILITQCIKSQSFIQELSSDCGTWQPQPAYYTEWKTIDTILKSPIKNNIRSWVNSDEKLLVSNMTTMEYAPCGNGRPTRYIQYRICKITGIQQTRTKIIEYKYIPKPKTEYEKTVDSLKENH